jgi:hypothetical protein
MQTARERRHTASLYWRVPGGHLRASREPGPEPATAINHGEDRGHTRSGLLVADVEPVYRPVATTTEGLRNHFSPEVTD